MSSSTYKSLRRSITEKQKQLQRAQTLCTRLSDQLFALQEHMWQTETGARLRRERCLQLLADINESDSGPTTESS
jgi:predicted  nucleic acid-binding Zn-ribbon protein